jgi:ABC-2 type transport system ATP-binding protein
METSVFEPVIIATIAAGRVERAIMATIAAMNTTIARAEGLRFEYPGVRALDDVSFALERGSVTALVGPNGAGKSTLLRCLAGLETPALGRIEIAGVDVLDSPREAHVRLGYLSDFFGVYETLTVRQCLTHAGAVHGAPESELAAAVERTAGRLNLTDRLEVAAGALSRGLRQRLAIGQSIIHSPQLLLLDEPAAGLDPEARHSLAALFRQLQSDGMTLVVSSHILAELDEYSTDMLVLRNGRVVEQRRLHTGAEGQKRRLEVGLAAPDARLAVVLAMQPNVESVAVDGARASFLWQGDEGARAVLLKTLIEAGLAVTSFEESRENLHDSYLRTVATP